MSLSEAQYKNHLSTKWCEFMLDTIEQEKYRPNSKNYIAPTKAMTIQWCAESWDEISKEHVINGCRKCYMDPKDLDEEMEQYDGVDLDTIEYKPEK